MVFGFWKLHHVDLTWAFEEHFWTENLHLASIGNSFNPWTPTEFDISQSFNASVSSTKAVPPSFSQTKLKSEWCWNLYIVKNLLSLLSCPAGKKAEDLSSLWGWPESKKEAFRSDVINPLWLFPHNICDSLALPHWAKCPYLSNPESYSSSCA